MAGTVHPQSEKNFGEPIKYDPDFNGPLHRRSCTDVICLLLFVAFIVCWVAIAIFAVCKGDSNLLLVPRDSQHRRCGHDSGVRNKPYLFFIDITKCADPKVLITGCKTEQVCVDKCPENPYISDKDGLTGALCVDQKQPRDTNELKSLISDKKCAMWYLPTVSVTHRCIPRINKITDDFKDMFSLDELKSAIKNCKYLIKAEEMFSLVTEDIMQSWWKILLGFIGAIVFCLIYIILMRWIAGVMVWFSIIGVIVLLAFAVYQCALKYKCSLDKECFITSTDDENNIGEQKSLWLALLIISAIMLTLSLLILLFLRKRIVIAIALIREGSKAVSAVTSTLFFPIFPWIFQILIIAYAVTVGLYLTSVGTAVYKVRGIDSGCECPGFSNGDSCDSNFDFVCAKVLKNALCNASCSMDTIEKPMYIKVFHAVNIVGVFWGVFFVSALGDMILAATFATWYWTFHKSDVPFFTLLASMLRTFRYHLGTVAFGSLIITICRLIRIAIEYVDHKLKKYDNPIITGVLCCCKCFFWCLEKFLKFINKNAYIMCAIHGKNFCVSAKDAFNLLMRNIVRVFVVDKVTDMLFFLGKILITAAVSIVAYVAFTNANFNVVNTEDLHYAVVPVIVIAIGTYIISSVFFSVYSMAVDTLFLCFLEDCERNDGSQNKPYFMSKELMKILGKKNKKD